MTVEELTKERDVLLSLVESLVDEIPCIDGKRYFKSESYCVLATGDELQIFKDYLPGLIT